MVLVIAQLCLSLVSSRRYSFGLLIRSLFSSLPVPFPVNIRLLNCYFLVSRLIFLIIFVLVFVLWFLVSRIPLLIIQCCYLFWFVWFRPTPVPDYASSLTPWYHRPVIPGFDPLGPVIGFSWTLLFADIRFWTVIHSLKLVPIKNTISLFLNSVWRLVPVTQS